MEAMYLDGDERHAFIKYQIMQYASIYEAVISNLIWNRFKDAPEVKKLEAHLVLVQVDALSTLTKMTYNDENLYACVFREKKKLRNNISFSDKVDCAVNLGIVSPEYAEEIKRFYRLRNLAHIESEAQKQIEIELEDSRKAYWRMQPFLSHIARVLSAG